MRNYLSIEKFHEHAQAGSVPEDVLLRKQIAAEVEVADDDSREVLFTISTAMVDRAGDSIAVEGWDTGNYQKNPVVLWCHDQTQLPVARAAKTYVDKRALKSLAVFTAPDLYPFGYQVYRMYRAGFLSAVSVGFNPLKYAFVEDKERRGVDFLSQELLEYSAVPVPCNAEALVAAKGSDLTAEPLIQWAKAVIRDHIKPEIKTVRELEDFLRDVGAFSRKEATALASASWHDIQAQRDADAGAGASTAAAADIQRDADDVAKLQLLIAQRQIQITNLKGVCK